MAELTNPTDIARETLRLLASKRIPPTPQNYVRIYNELTGAPFEASGKGGGTDEIAAAVRRLAAGNPGDPALQTLHAAAEQRNADGFAVAMEAILASRSNTGSELGPLLKEVLRQLDTAHRGITLSRKREGLERVLSGFANDPQLSVKLKSLMRSWSDDAAAVAGSAAPIGSGVAPAAEAGSVSDLKELLASALENGVAPRLERYPDIYPDVFLMSRRAREAVRPEDWSRLAAQLKQFWLKVELRLEPDEELIDNLLRLVGLVVNNLGELVDDDQWIHGQVAVLRELINKPVDLRAIREAERGFKEVIFRQAQIKSSLREAKATLKSLLSVFIERLGEVTEHTVEYHGKIERYAERISSTDSMDALKVLVDELMSDTRGMQVDMVRSRDELLTAKAQALVAEQRVTELEGELVRVSEQVREDQLTGALNRRGMEDAMDREIARASRTKKPLCISVLDVDNFKKLNDTHGHAAGDAALVHLAKVIKHTVRPTDVIARFGGEEFIIILTETAMDEAIRVTGRLQRELTKRFFLHNNERLLITFSAGVAQFRDGDTDESLFQRADKAMYQAKVQGKNRVVSDE
ncbi:MAG: GGDEF domain-containing protein [Betaproteobacteria bacterium]